MELVRLDGPKEVVIAVSVSDLADTTTIRKHSLRHIEDIVACGVFCKHRGRRVGVIVSECRRVWRPGQGCDGLVNGLGLHVLGACGR